MEGPVGVDHASGWGGWTGGWTNVGGGWIGGWTGAWTMPVGGAVGGEVRRPCQWNFVSFSCYTCSAGISLLTSGVSCLSPPCTQVLNFQTASSGSVLSPCPPSCISESIHNLLPLCPPLTLSTHWSTTHIVHPLVHPFAWSTHRSTHQSTYEYCF